MLTAGEMVKTHAVRGRRDPGEFVDSGRALLRLVRTGEPICRPLVRGIAFRPGQPHTDTSYRSDASGTVA